MSVNIDKPLWKPSLRKSSGGSKMCSETYFLQEWEKSADKKREISPKLTFPARGSKRSNREPDNRKSQIEENLSPDDKYIYEIVKKAEAHWIKLQPSHNKASEYCFADSHLEKRVSSMDGQQYSLIMRTSSDDAERMENKAKLSIGAYGLLDGSLPEADDSESKVMFEDYVDSDDPDLFKLNARALAKVRLMDECQAPKVMKKYKDKDRMKLVWRPAEFTKEGEVAATKVRKRLFNLIGTDEICLNDRDYMANLQEKIEEEHSRRLIQREKFLRDQEKKRMRKLFLDGVIDSEDYDEWTFRRIKENDRNVTSFNEELCPDFCPNPAQLTFREILEEKYKEGEDDGREKKKTSAKNESSSEETTATESQLKSESQLDDRTDTDNSQNTLEESSDKNGKAAVTTPDSQPNKSCRPYSARMQQLENEEDISAMYELARQMVYVSTSDRKGK